MLDTDGGSDFQAFKKHKIVDMFETPGQCDLTANVDFALLREAAETDKGEYGQVVVRLPEINALLVFCYGPKSQSEFLSAMGLGARTLRLMQQAPEDRKKVIQDAAMKLVDTGPQGMGRKFQVLATVSSPTPTYPFA